jgi:SAM-dependent methyltransferase
MRDGFGVDGGWEKSAEAWIAAMGEQGDFARQFILDPALLERIRASRYRNALDVGCGEGRFCRLLRTVGVHATGLDPAPSLLEQAARLDPHGSYLVGAAEELPFESESFDLVVCYMSLLCVADLARASAQIVRVLQPSGTLLIANLHSVVTAGIGLRSGNDIVSRFDNTPYFECVPKQVKWDGIDVLNWHRPLSTYFQTFLEKGLELRWFCEPVPVRADPRLTAPFEQIPHFFIMEWQK